MRSGGRGEMWMAISYDTLVVELSSEGVSYAPDVAADMVTHLVRAFTASISELKAQSIVMVGAETDEDETDDDEDE